MTAVMLNKIRDYRWELVLFFGVSLAAWSARELFYQGIPWQGDSFDGSIYLWNHLPGSIVALGALASSNRWVCRLQRPILVAIWQFSVAVNVLEIPVLAALAISLLSSEAGLQIAWCLAIGAVNIRFAAHCILLVWFAKRVSRWGFEKSLVLIAVSLFPGITPPSPNTSIYVVEEVGAITLQIVMSLIAMRAVHLSDSQNPLGGKGLAVLFVACVVAFVSVFVPQFVEWADYLDWDSEELFYLVQVNSLWIFVPYAIEYGLALALAYVMRVKPKPPTDEEEVEFVGLYTRRG